MSADYFLDTNILVYSFDRSAPEKQQTAMGLINRGLTTGSGIISSQVVQEFINVSRHKFTVPLTAEHSHRFLTNVLEPMCQVFSTINLYRDALDISQRWQYHFYDALIIAAALEAKCGVLYSEDLQHGQDIRGMRIENPFE